LGLSPSHVRDAVGVLAGQPDPFAKAINFAELDGMNFPAPSYLVDKILPRGGITLLAGPPKIGKSYLALGVALVVAQNPEGYRRAGEREERARLARADESFRRALDDWVVRQSSAAGVPMRDVYRSLESGREMPPGVGMSHGERLAYVSATMDLEDAQERSRRRAALRRAGVDPALHYEIAARMMPDDADPAAVGRGVRARWLRRQYRGME
jgi:hypothetical protein